MSQFVVQKTTGQGVGAKDKTVRVLKMAWLLQARDCTVEHLVSRFGVSRRTVYRDLRLIDEAELPLVGQRLSRGYRLSGDVCEGVAERHPPRFC
jgi:DNA-binding transcriptional ArsR family regulator